MFQERLTVFSNDKVTPDYRVLRLEIGEREEETRIGNTAGAGQFIQLRVHNGTAPLLRRPFTFYKARRRFIEILYKVVGEGTSILAHTRESDTVDIIGPLGNGFSFVPDVDEHIMIAGGSGLASMYLLSRLCGKNGQAPVLYVGAKDKSEIALKKTVAEDFNGLGIPIKIWTDNGSLGNPGPVTEGLEKAITKAPGKKFAVYASGPTPMLRRVHEITSEHGIPTQVSFEARMACGTGLCEGCVIKVKKDGGEFVCKKVCKDGPVFDPNDIDQI